MFSIHRAFILMSSINPKKEFLNFGGYTEDLQKRADAMLKAVNEHATRERQMEKAIKNMDQLDALSLGCGSHLLVGSLYSRTSRRRCNLGPGPDSRVLAKIPGLGSKTQKGQKW